MGGAVFPSLWFFVLSHPSPWTCRLLRGARSWWKNGSLQEGSCQWVLPRTTAESIFVPTVSQFPSPTPPTTFTGNPPIAAGRSGPSSCEVTAFYPGSWGTRGLVFSLQEWSFCLPQSCAIPAIKPTDLQSQMLSGLLFPMPDPQAVEPDPGLSSFTPVGEPLHYNNFLLLWVTHLGGNGTWFDCNGPPILPSCCGVYICLWI